MKRIRIFRCEICGSIVAIVSGDTNTLTCCGKQMKEILPSYEDTTVDGINEKHVPVVKKMGKYVCINIGEKVHPMVEKHHISWILIQTNKGFKINYLGYGNKAETKFILTKGEALLGVYAYCNIHGLWIKEII